MLIVSNDFRLFLALRGASRIRRSPFFFFFVAYPFACLLFRFLVISVAFCFTRSLFLFFFLVAAATLPQRVSSLGPLQEKGVDVGVPPEAGRSAWNEAGTWEEVEKTEWCKEKLTEALRCVYEIVCLRQLPPHVLSFFVCPFRT